MDDRSGSAAITSSPPRRGGETAGTTGILFDDDPPGGRFGPGRGGTAGPGAGRTSGTRTDAGTGSAATGLDVSRDAVGRAGGCASTGHRRWVARDLGAKAAELGRARRWEEAIAFYDEVVALCGEAPDAALHQLVAEASCNKAFACRVLRRPGEAILVCDELVARLGDSPQEPVAERVAEALYGKACALGMLGRHDDQLQVYDEIVARFGAVPKPSLQDQVARARTAQGAALGKLGRTDEAVALFDQVRTAVGDVADLGLARRAADAGRRRRWALGERAASPLDALIQRLTQTIVLPDGRLMAYSDMGDPHGPAVLLAHRTPDCRLCGATLHGGCQMAGLRLLTPDRPGWGLSTPVAEPSQSAWAQDATFLLDHLGIDTLATLGTSGGGGYAAAVGAALPDRVRAVALVAAACPRSGSTGGESALQERLLRSPLGGPLRALDALPVRILRRKQSDPFVVEMLEGLEGNGIMAIMVEASRQGYATKRIELQRADLWDLDLASVRQPVHIWHGAKDRRTSVRRAQRLAEALPDGRITIVPGGHAGPAVHARSWLGWLRAQLDDESRRSTCMSRQGHLAAQDRDSAASPRRASLE